MAILLSETQAALAEAARRLVAAHGERAGLLRLLETPGAWDEAFWAAAVADGWSAAAVPEAHGGLGLGLVEAGLLAQAAGAGAVGAPWLAASVVLGLELPRSGNEAVAAEWAPRIAAGVRLALAMGEGGETMPALPPVAPQASIRNDRLYGVKRAVVGGATADAALVWAQFDDRPIPVLAMVALREGVTRRVINGFDNSRLAADLEFDDAPAVALRVGEGAWYVMRRIMATWATMTAFEQLGGAEALLWRARDHALERKAFGQPIGAFQSVKHRIAELYVLVELARGNCLRAAASDGSRDFLRDAAAARLSASEAYDTAARDCVQIHGGSGTVWDSDLHLHMRRARSLAGECGNTLAWEDWLVDELAGAAA